jgi:hypothetical protein
MAIRAALFKPKPRLQGPLSGCGFPAIVIIEPRTQKQNGQETP